MPTAPLEPATPDTPEESALLTRQPLVWLLVILVLALGLRLGKLTEQLQRDEFGSVYAIAERKTSSPDTPPTNADPLAPVAGLGEVSERSVLPFGVRNPLPLYHDILYFTVKVLPISEWSLRLPSLLAGLGCVLGIYFLCRRLAGLELALIAALFVAIDPMQVATSVLARPYALGNLACVLSFAALFGLLNAAKPGTAALMAVGYGAAVAFIGYMNHVLLLVVVAHVALVIYWAVAHREKLFQIACAGGGLVLSVLLLAPEFGYFGQLHEFSYGHRAEIARLFPMELKSFLFHNSTFLAGLLVAAVAGLIVRYQMQSGEEKSAEGQEAEAAGKPSEPDPVLAYAAARGAEPAAAAVAEAAAVKSAPVPPPPPDNPDAVWMGRLWIFLPQLVAMVLAYSLTEAIFFSRYLSYTTLGGVIILAYYVTRSPTPKARLGVAAAVAAAIFGMSFSPWGRGHHLSDNSNAKQLVAGLDSTKSLNPGDVILFRSNLMEGDFLHDQVPAENRRHLAGAIAAPLTTLYVPAKPVRVVVLSLSHNGPYSRLGPRGAKPRATAGAGELFDPERFYTPDLAAQLRNAPGQFWFVNDAVLQWHEFLTCFLPWLANQTGYDLKVARQRTEEGRYFTVQSEARPDDFLDGLANSARGDFGLAWQVVSVQRLHPTRPRLVTNVGAFALTPIADNPITAAAAVWLSMQDRTPRLASAPE